MAKRKRIEQHTVQYHAWEKLSNTSKELHECSKIIDNYKKVLIQISQITKRNELETNCKPEEKWSLEYSWTVSSAKDITNFVNIYLDSMKQRQRDLQEMHAMPGKSSEQVLNLNKLIQIYNTELRRWKRLIRYDLKEDKIDLIEKKTSEWILKFVKAWSVVEQKYEHLDKKFFSMYHAFKITSVDKNK